MDAAAALNAFYVGVPSNSQAEQLVQDKATIGRNQMITVLYSHIDIV